MKIKCTYKEQQIECKYQVFHTFHSSLDHLYGFSVPVRKWSYLLFIFGDQTKTGSDLVTKIDKKAIYSSVYNDMKKKSKHENTYTNFKSVLVFSSVSVLLL